MILWPAKTPSRLWAEAGAAEMVRAIAAAKVIIAKIINGLTERFILGSWFGELRLWAAIRPVRNDDDCVGEKQVTAFRQGSGHAINVERIRGSYRMYNRELHENAESLFDRLGYWNCGWLGVVDIRCRGSDVAGSPALGELFADAGYDHCHSDCMASFDYNEFTIIEGPVVCWIPAIR
jgi:hypothetical protein